MAAVPGTNRGAHRSGGPGHCWNVRGEEWPAITLRGGPELVLLAVADLGPHPALFPAHLASSLTFPHRIHSPSVPLPESPEGALV